jgi:hypothetical protein
VHSGTVHLPLCRPVVTTMAPCSSAVPQLQITIKPLFPNILLISYLNSGFYEPPTTATSSKPNEINNLNTNQRTSPDFHHQAKSLFLNILHVSRLDSRFCDLIQASPPAKSHGFNNLSPLTKNDEKDARCPEPLRVRRQSCDKPKSANLLEFAP